MAKMFKFVLRSKANDPNSKIVGTATVIAKDYQSAFDEISQHAEMKDVEIDKEADLNDIIDNKGAAIIITNSLLPF